MHFINIFFKIVIIKIYRAQICMRIPSNTSKKELKYATAKINSRNPQPRASPSLLPRYPQCLFHLATDIAASTS